MSTLIPMLPPCLLLKNIPLKNLSLNLSTTNFCYHAECIFRWNLWVIVAVSPHNCQKYKQPAAGLKTSIHGRIFRVLIRTCLRVPNNKDLWVVNASTLPTHTFCTLEACASVFTTTVHTCLQGDGGMHQKKTANKRCQKYYTSPGLTGDACLRTQAEQCNCFSFI